MLCKVKKDLTHLYEIHPINITPSKDYNLYQNLYQYIILGDNTQVEQQILNIIVSQIFEAFQEKDVSEVQKYIFDFFDEEFKFFPKDEEKEDLYQVVPKTFIFDNFIYMSPLYYMNSNMWFYRVEELLNSDLDENKYAELCYSHFQNPDDCHCEIEKFFYRKQVKCYKNLRNSFNWYLSQNFNFRTLYWFYERCGYDQKKLVEEINTYFKNICKITSMSKKKFYINDSEILGMFENSPKILSIKIQNTAE